MANFGVQKVVITDNTPRIISEKENAASLAVRFAIEDIHRKSTAGTPKRTGALRADIRKRVTGTKGRIQWGRHYAEYQERGYTSGPVKRYTTPGTGPRFAETAAREVGSDPKKYFKMAGLVR